MSATHKNILDHILGRTKINEEDCWIWQGGMSARRYGQLGWRNKLWRVHRLMWVLFYGAIPEGLFVCHHCDVPLCCNPEHLFLGTSKDNMRDAASKARMQRGDKKRNAKLKPSDIPAIREDSRPCEVICLEYGVSHQAIRDAKNKKNWAWA